MPPKGRRKGKDDPFVADETKEESEPEKLNLGDAAGIKKALDAAVIEALRGKDIDLDYTLVDTRIAVGAVACVVACVAQFWPAKHPWNWWVCAICVSCYALLSLFLSFFAFAVEKDAIAWTKGGAGQPRLVISSSLPKWSDQWTLSVHPSGSNRDVGVKSTKSIGQFVHADGTVSTENVQKEVGALLEKKVQKKSQ